jgi:gluconokinase
MTLLLGIDVGTSSIKAVAYDPGTDQVVAFSRQPTSTHHPRPDWSEFDADELWAEHSGCHSRGRLLLILRVCAA